MADYVTTAKFGMTLSEPGEFSKSDYMTTAHFFAHQSKLLNSEWLTTSGAYSDKKSLSFRVSGLT